MEGETRGESAPERHSMTHPKGGPRRHGEAEVKMQKKHEERGDRKGAKEVVNEKMSAHIKNKHLTWPRGRPRRGGNQRVDRGRS